MEHIWSMAKFALEFTLIIKYHKKTHITPSSVLILSFDFIFFNFKFINCIYDCQSKSLLGKLVKVVCRK